MFLFTSFWAGIRASEGIDASDGVVSVEEWVSFKVTLSVYSRLLSVDSCLAGGGSLTLLLFFRTPDKNSVTLDFFVNGNSFHLFDLRCSSFCNSSDNGESFSIFFQISEQHFDKHSCSFPDMSFRTHLIKFENADNGQNLPFYVQ